MNDIRKLPDLISFRYMNDLKKPKLDYLFIIPTHNEAGIIGKSLDLLRHYLSTDWVDRQTSWKILVANNGSTDETAKIVLDHSRQYPDKIELFEVSVPGRGNALKKSVELYEAGVYMYIDSDIPISLEEIPALLEPVRIGAADVVVGRRVGKRPFIRRCMTWALRMVNLIFFDLSIHDSQCGIKVFNKETALLLTSLQENGFFLDSELLITASQKGMKILEVPIHWIEARFDKRKTKVKFASDSKKALIALGKLFIRLYPGAISNLSILMLIGLTVVGLFAFQLFAISPQSFEVWRVDKYLTNQVTFLLISSALIFVVWVIAVQRIKQMPWNLLLCLILFLFTISSVLSIITHPTLSQDLFWSLLLVKGWMQDGQNPYITTPNMIINPEWSHTVIAWRNMSMTYGPLWVWIVFLATTMGLSLGGSIVILKVIELCALIGAGYFIWKICDELLYTKEKKIKILALLAINPFIFQTVLVDGHNDVFIMLSITASYYYLLKRQYSISLISLIVGGFIKYVPWYLIPIPLFMLVKGKKITKLLKDLLLVALFAVLFGAAMYLPFWQNGRMMEGVSDGIIGAASYSDVMIGTVALYALPFIDLTLEQIRSLGLISGMILMMFYVFIKKDNLRAYVVPLLFIFFFATPWFMPWYFLWILPLMSFIYPPSLIILICSSLTLSQGVISTISGSIIVIAIVIYAKFYLYIFKKGRHDKSIG